jgi:hypothetical protein
MKPLETASYADVPVFTAHWLAGDTDEFKKGDYFDARQSGGSTEGFGLSGKWIDIGPEGAKWEWVNYGGDSRAAPTFVDHRTSEEISWRRGMSLYPRVKPNGWRDRVRDVYSSVEELEAYDETHGILRRLKWDGDAQSLWDANPMLAGSVNPGDLRIVRGAAYREKQVAGGARVRARLPRDRYFVFQGSKLVAGPISKDGALVRTHHDPSLVYYVAQNTVQFEELKRGVIPAGLYASSAKLNPSHGTYSEITFTDGVAEVMAHKSGGKWIRVYAYAEDVKGCTFPDKWKWEPSPGNKMFVNLVSPSPSAAVRWMMGNGFHGDEDAKSNGWKHARPYGGSVGREQWHVHFEDEKGVLHYVTGTRDKDHRILLSRNYTEAAKFTPQRAAQLAKRLGRLYDSVNGGNGRFFAEGKGVMKVNGESRRFKAIKRMIEGADTRQKFEKIGKSLDAYHANGHVTWSEYRDLLEVLKEQGRFLGERYVKNNGGA